MHWTHPVACSRIPSRTSLATVLARTKVTTRTTADGVVIVALDDGKMNAVTIGMLDTMDEALNGAKGAKAVILTGNAKCFSAGFDLSVMGKLPSAEAGELFRRGADFAMRLAEFPRPTLVAAAGHGLAFGAIMLLAADLRIGPQDRPNAKVGLNEVAIGMPLPASVALLARLRLNPSAVTLSCGLGRTLTPAEAVAAGYLDLLAPADQVLATAEREAQTLGKLGTDAFSMTKTFLRRGALEAARQVMAKDVNFIAKGTWKC